MLPSVCGGRGDHLPDAALLQLAGEGALGAPGDVLAVVVGQHLRRCAVAVQRRPEQLSTSADDWLARRPWCKETLCAWKHKVDLEGPAGPFDSPRGTASGSRLPG